MIVRARPDIDQPELLKCLKGNCSPINQKERNTFFFNRGSSSLLFFLSLFGKGKRVGLQVFTCSTVLDTIKSAGDIAVLMDINKDYFSTTYDIVKEVIDSIDILILSHLFGIPNPDYILIKDLCKQKGVVLIDDLCQTFHAKVGGKYLENLSDNYFYSFFYDKPVTSGNGGMLKLADCFLDTANKHFKELAQDSPSIGKRNLRKLYWMHHLLAPEVYHRDFRNPSLWNDFLLGYYPLSWPIKPLRFLLNSLIGRVFCKLKLTVPKAKVKRMSNMQITYTLHQIHSFTNNNPIFLQLCQKYGINIPSYMQNPSIVCSLGKRAIVHTKGSLISRSRAEIGLYNWPCLLSSDFKSFPMASSVLQEYVNFPIWYSDL